MSESVENTLQVQPNITSDAIKRDARFINSFHPAAKLTYAFNGGFNDWYSQLVDTILNIRKYNIETITTAVSSQDSVTMQILPNNYNQPWIVDKASNYCPPPSFRTFVEEKVDTRIENHPHISGNKLEVVKNEPLILQASNGNLLGIQLQPPSDHVFSEAVNKINNVLQGDINPEIKFKNNFNDFCDNCNNVLGLSDVRYEVLIANTKCDNNKIKQVFPKAIFCQRCYDNNTCKPQLFVKHNECVISEKYHKAINERCNHIIEKEELTKLYGCMGRSEYMLGSIFDWVNFVHDENDPRSSYYLNCNPHSCHYGAVMLKHYFGNSLFDYFLVSKTFDEFMLIIYQWVNENIESSMTLRELIIKEILE